MIGRIKAVVPRREQNPKSRGGTDFHHRRRARFCTCPDCTNLDRRHHMIYRDFVSARSISALRNFVVSSCIKELPARQRVISTRLRILLKTSPFQKYSSMHEFLLSFSFAEYLKV